MINNTATNMEETHINYSKSFRIESSINSRCQHGQCALHIAAKNMNFEELNVLLQDIKLHKNATDNYGKNVLHHLIEAPCFQQFDEFERCALLLLENGVDLNAQDKVGETPLHKVFQNHNELIPKIISLLLKQSVNVNHEIKDLDGMTFFHIMVSSVQADILDSVNCDTMIEGKEKMIRDYLCGRIVDIAPDVIKRLLNEPDNKGSSAFHTYVDSEQFSTETIDIMVKLGGDVNTSTYIGITPLMAAALRARDDVVDILLRSGADVNKTDIFQQTAIFRARTEHAFDRLCEYGAVLNVKDIFGRCPIANRSLYTPIGFPNFGLTLQSDLAIHPPLALRFLQHGVDVNSTDRFGSTLLHYAAWHSDVNMINVLLDNGASKDSIDSQGYTPYDLAFHYHNFEVFSLLQGENNPNVAAASHDIEKQKRYGGYTRYVINHREVDDMEQTLNELKIEDDAEDLIKTLLSSPRTGLTDRQAEFVEVKQGIHKLLSRIACKVSELDSRFQCTLFPTGSSAEGSQISDPVEMDFVLSLDYFESQCEVVQTEDVLYKGFARLKIRNVDHSHPLIGFADENEEVLSHQVRDRFTDLIVQAVNRKDTWDSEHIYFDGLLKFPEDKPIVNLQVEWYGAKTKSITISIDIVPAIHKTNWVPKDVDLSKMILLSERVKAAGFFLLFHTPEKSSEDLDSSWNLLRISSAPMEIAILQSVPDVFRESFGISKILKSIYFSPHVQFSDDDEEDEFISDDNGSIEEIEIENNNVSFDTTKSHRLQRENRLVHCIMPTSENKSTIVESSENKEKAEISIQKGAGWIVLLDNEEKIHKIYMPKENESKPLEKFFENVIKDAPSVHVIKEEKGKDVDTKQVTENFVTSGEQYLAMAKSSNTSKNFQNKDESKNGKSCGIIKYEIETLNEVDENKKECNDMNSIKDMETDTINKTEENVSIVSSSNLSDEFAGGPVVSARQEISSYMLKNCLFYTILRIRDENLTDLSYLQVTKMIFETLLSKAQEKHLSAYVLPYINIFSYVDSQIRLLSEDETSRELTKHCERIQSFCKLILGILSQTDLKK